MPPAQQQQQQQDTLLLGRDLSRAENLEIVDALRRLSHDPGFRILRAELAARAAAYRDQLERADADKPGRFARLQGYARAYGEAADLVDDLIDGLNERRPPSSSAAADEGEPAAPWVTMGHEGSGRASGADGYDGDFTQLARQFRRKRSSQGAGYGGGGTSGGGGTAA